MNTIWCSNAIRVTGDKAHIIKVAEFIRTAKERRRFFDLAYPAPPNTTATRILEWQRENWGTKWDIDWSKFWFVIDEKFIEVACVTVDAPPIEFFRKFSSDYGVLIEISYGVPLRYTGTAICEDGQISLTHRGDISI